MATYHHLSEELDPDIELFTRLGSLPREHDGSDEEDVEDEYAQANQRRPFLENGDEGGPKVFAGTHGLSLDIDARRRLWWREALLNSLFIGSWFTFATLLSLYNKWMFSPAKFAFPNPLFVTMMHMLVQFGLAALLRAVFPDTFKPTRSPTVKDYTKNALPCAITTGLDIGLSNLSLKTISLAFYTMCKSSSLIFVLVFAFLFRLESFSWRLTTVMFLIFSGVVLMVATETHFVLGGMLLVLSASAFGGLRWALTQILLGQREMGMDNPAATIYWLAPAMGLSLAILSFIIEGWSALFFHSVFFDGFWTSLRTIAFVVMPGVIAFAMVMSEFYILQRVGMVPMSIAGIFKEVTTITLSTWVFKDDDLTPINMVGVGITMLGIALFTWHKYQKSVHSPVPLDGHGNPFVEHEIVEPEDEERWRRRRRSGSNTVRQAIPLGIETDERS